jgi:glycosidase
MIPHWAKGAVWYQIFPERFCNGDPANDPTAADAGLEDYPHWQISPWTSNWYELQAWEKAYHPKFYAIASSRRYGGDVQGMIDRLDHLASLHVTAIYLNPVFDARSSHKYDAATYHHIDHNFGPDPVGDRRLVVQETDDPQSWQWTKADSLFLRFIRAAHARGLKVIIDGVFNHVGRDFWAFRDVRQKGAASSYANWFVIRAWDDPGTPQDEFAYQGFWDLRSMPVFREERQGLVPGPREYVFAITKRWMDPNGDGDPGDGVDGWRLDALSEMTADGFWVDWCQLVRQINPQAYTVGEIWELADEWLAGGRFDAVMNYPVAYAVRNFFIGGEERWHAGRFDAELKEIRARYRAGTNHLMQVLIDSHDTDRVASMAKNDGSRGYDQNAGPRANPEYDPTKPAADDFRTQKMIAAFQAAYVGAPMIYYGDEAGMWGGDDPDCRKPMVWPEKQYEPETYASISRYTERDSVSFDHDLFAHYQVLLGLRKHHTALREGDFTTLHAEETGGIYAFQRQHEDDTVIAVFNVSTTEREVSLLLENAAPQVWQEVLSGTSAAVSKKELAIVMAPRTAQIWVKAAAP